MAGSPGAEAVRERLRRLAELSEDRPVTAREVAFERWMAERDAERARRTGAADARKRRPRIGKPAPARQWWND